MFSFRKHISWLLISTFMLGMVWQTATIVHFYANQEKIAEAHCVNKSRPELNCKGQCHLNKKLQKNNPAPETSQAQTNTTKTGLVFLLAFTHLRENILPDNREISMAIPEQPALYQHTFITAIFEPPRCV